MRLLNWPAVVVDCSAIAPWMPFILPNSTSASVTAEALRSTTAFCPMKDRLILSPAILAVMPSFSIGSSSPRAAAPIASVVSLNCKPNADERSPSAVSLSVVGFTPRTRSCVKASVMFSTSNGVRLAKSWIIENASAALSVDPSTVFKRARRLSKFAPVVMISLPSS